MHAHLRVPGEWRAGGCGIAIEPVRNGSGPVPSSSFPSHRQQVGPTLSSSSSLRPSLWLSVGDVGVDPPFLSESLSRLDSVRLRLC